MYINLDVLNITKNDISIADTEFGTMNIKKIEAGKLKLITGKIIATDPLSLYDDECFSEYVKPGIYPVNIFVGKAKNRKRQTIAAEIKFNDNVPVKWEMALLKNECSKYLHRDEFMGYEVENGLGCFMDKKAMEHLDIYSEEQLKNYEETVRNAVNEDINSCGDIVINEANGMNVVVFSSGWNEGTFPSYYGFDEKNNLSKIVTDYMVIEI